MDVSRREFLAVAAGGLLVYGHSQDSSFGGAGGPVTDFDSTVRHNAFEPLTGGMAISSETTPGVATLGCCVLDADGNESLLTSRHLVDTEFCESGEDELVGLAVTNVEDEKIAEVTAASSTSGQGSNDWLVAKLHDHDQYSNSVIGFDEIGEPKDPDVGDRIVMSGYRTGLIGGVITETGISTNLTGCLINNISRYEIDGDTDTAGNSGSLVGTVEGEVFRPIGIHTFGGSDGDRYAMEINAIIDESGLTIEGGEANHGQPTHPFEQVEATVIDYNGDVLVSNLDTSTAEADVLIIDSDGDEIDSHSLDLDGGENRIISTAYEPGDQLRINDKTTEIAH